MTAVPIGYSLATARHGPGDTASDVLAAINRIMHASTSSPNSSGVRFRPVSALATPEFMGKLIREHARLAREAKREPTAAKSGVALKAAPLPVALGVMVFAWSEATGFRGDR